MDANYEILATRSTSNPRAFDIPVIGESESELFFYFSFSSMAARLGCAYAT